MKGTRRREKRARRRYLRWWKRNSPRFAVLRAEKQVHVVPIVAYLMEGIERRNPGTAEYIRSRLEWGLPSPTDAELAAIPESRRATDPAVDAVFKARSGGGPP